MAKTQKLSQVISVEKGVKTRAIAAIDVVDKVFQKPALFDGHTKTYQKKAENDEDVPPQNQRVQHKVGEGLHIIVERLSELFDVTAAKDYANCQAKGTIEVGDEVIAEGVPATYLLFLEKQLTDLHTLVARAPVLDPAEAWTFDQAAELYRSAPTLTTRTKKVQKALVLYPHSEKHPAQTQLITEDEGVGTWSMTRLSGAIPERERRSILDKIERLQRAVKYAREAANAVDAPEQTIGTKVVAWLGLRGKVV